MKKFFITFFTVLFFASALFSSIQRFTPDARNSVLKNVASFDDGFYSIYNPSFHSKNYGFSASYVPMEYDENLSHLLFNFPLKNYFFQADYSRFLSQGIEIWDKEGVFVKNSDYDESLISLNLIKQFVINNRNFDLGFRYHYNEASFLDDQIYSKNYFDVGIKTILKNDFAFGFSLLEIGDEDEKIALGLAKNWIFDWYASIFQATNKNDFQYSLSGEKKVSKNFSVLFGIDEDLISSDSDFMSGINLGASFNFKNFVIEYAFSKRGELGFLNYFTFRYNFDSLNSSQKTENKIENVDMKIAETTDTEVKKYKVGVSFSDAKGYGSDIQDLIIKNLKTEKALDVLSAKEFENLMTEETNPQVIDILISYNLISQKDFYTLEIEYFDTQVKKVIFQNTSELYRLRNIASNVRKMVIEFLAGNQDLILDGRLENNIAASSPPEIEGTSGQSSGQTNEQANVQIEPETEDDALNYVAIESKIEKLENPEVLLDDKNMQENLQNVEIAKPEQKAIVENVDGNYKADAQPEILATQDLGIFESEQKVVSDDKAEKLENLQVLLDDKNMQENLQNVEIVKPEQKAIVENVDENYKADAQPEILATQKFEIFEPEQNVVSADKIEENGNLQVFSDDKSIEEKTENIEVVNFEEKSFTENVDENYKDLETYIENLKKTKK